MKLNDISYAIIGGSSTFSISFPEDAGDDTVKIIAKDEVHSTPFGDSPPVTIFEIDGSPVKKVVTCTMHGWMPDRSRADSSRQLFSLFRSMGVKTILAEGGVGCINKDMKPGDIFVPDDYIDFSLRRDVNITSDYLLIMRDPICPRLKECALEEIKAHSDLNVIKKGVYAVTDGRHFESRAEIRALSVLGADAVGQSFSPEVYLAREIGACYLGVYLVVNFAEGVVDEWDYSEFKDLFYSKSKSMANILIDTVKRHDAGDEKMCSCKELRVETLLKK